MLKKGQKKCMHCPWEQKGGSERLKSGGLGFTGIPLQWDLLGS